jgi:hypothetical protein
MVDIDVSEKNYLAAVDAAVVVDAADTAVAVFSVDPVDLTCCSSRLVLISMLRFCLLGTVS